MGNSKVQPGPKSVIATNDPGDETQRNFRYQVAYGVILLIGSASKRLPYVSVYAEHHEDYLCERVDGKFDGYQVKTRRPEEGAWQLLDEPFKKSLKRFAELCQKFGDCIEELRFVSNVDYSNPSDKSNDVAKIRKSPVRLLKHIGECDSEKDILSPFDETFQELQRYCECSPSVLFGVLKKVGLVNGPDRKSFDSEILVTHLPVLDECKTLMLPQLIAIRDELIQKVSYASSLKIDDPSKHWVPINISDEQNPTIKAKRITVEECVRTVSEKTAPPFRYSSTRHPVLNLGNGKGNLSKLKKKMLKGDLAFQIETMERRSLSAEQRLMEAAIRKPEAVDDMLNQLASIVKAECDEAYHHAALSGKVIGPQMLDDVFRRLKKKADSNLTYKEPYETLIGIAGLLTGECKVWWSEVFDVEEQNEL
jgi:hypothetical protein